MNSAFEYGFVSIIFGPVPISVCDGSLCANLVFQTVFQVTTAGDLQLLLTAGILYFSYCSLVYSLVWVSKPVMWFHQPCILALLASFPLNLLQVVGRPSSDPCIDCPTVNPDVRRNVVSPLLHIVLHYKHPFL